MPSEPFKVSPGETLSTGMYAGWIVGAIGTTGGERYVWLENTNHHIAMIPYAFLEEDHAE